MEHRAGLSAAEREIERIEERRKKLIEMVMEGVPPSEVKDELTANAARREALRARVAAADAPPPLLHPEMAGLYRQKVTALARAPKTPRPRKKSLGGLSGFYQPYRQPPTRGPPQNQTKG